MFWIREAIFATLLIVSCNGEAKEYKKKSTEGVKRAVETYSYPVPTVAFDEKESTPKGKVIVETIKSISPSEYLTSPGYVSSSTTLEGSTTTTTGNVPVASVTFDAFESDTSKKSTTVSLVSTETTPAVTKKKPSYTRHYTGSSSGSPKQTTSSVQVSSTNSPAPVRTTSVEPATTLFPGYQYTPPRSSNVAHSSSLGESAIAHQKSAALRLIASRGKIGNGRYTLQKLIKKPTKIDSKHSDSKPEETGYNGYHYDVGTLSFDSKNSGSQSGSMGASYMRSSSPFYNYHVMLD